VCTQKPGKSLRDFIRRFSKRCTELPSVAQFEIVHAFFEGTTYWDLVRELGRSPPVDSNELFDIATNFASGEEAVGAIFDSKKGKRVDVDGVFWYIKHVHYTLVWICLWN
jgi:hypothetical protein